MLGVGVMLGAGLPKMLSMVLGLGEMLAVGVMLAEGFGVMLSSQHTSSHLVAIKLVPMSHSLVLVSCSVECCLVIMPAHGR